MKARLTLLAAAILVAAGALADHLYTTFTQPVAAPSSAAQVVPASQPSTVSMTYTSAQDQATEHAYDVASPSIVYVLNQGSEGTASGSGVIYDSSGDIVTNDHVVSGASTLSVTLSGGQTYKATLVGTDPVDDLAVIHISASNLVPAHFGAAGSYRMAQTVLAIGSPLGLKQSVTSGLISGLHRVEQEPSGAYLPDAIQTSAPINPGNSGGALVTLDGTVVGIPTLEQTSTSDGTAAQGIGFAIPSERVTFIANQLIASGKVQHTGRAYLGISPSDSGGQSGSPFGGNFGGGFGFGGGNGDSGSSVSGAAVSQIAPNGPAARAGIQTGDVITSIDGQQVTSADDLLTVLASKKPGDTVTLKVNRNGSTLTVQVRLGELPASS
jgi:S1-C subfamily serine protease